MPTLLDNITEAHDGPEPRVLISDVQAVLKEVIPEGKQDSGASVALIAERAGVSTRTVYRVLNPEKDKTDISLALADSLCLAAGSHLVRCRLVFEDGTIRQYGEVSDIL